MWHLSARSAQQEKYKPRGLFSEFYGTSGTCQIFEQAIFFYKA